MYTEERPWSGGWIFSAYDSSRINCPASMCIYDPSFLTWLLFACTSGWQNQAGMKSLRSSHCSKSSKNGEAQKLERILPAPASFSSCSLFVPFGFSICTSCHPRAYIEKIKASLPPSVRLLCWCWSRQLLIYKARLELHMPRILSWIWYCILPVYMLNLQLKEWSKLRIVNISTEFPDDARFRVYKVYRKNKHKSGLV